jgi:hypothetical protein
MAADLVEIGKEVLKLALRARYSFSLWVVCLIILVVQTPAFLRLHAFREEYGQYLGFGCLIMFVVWVVEVILMGSELLKADLSARLEERTILKQLDSLNPREINLLVFAVSKKIQTVSWPPADDAVSSLVAKGLLLTVPDKSSMPYKPFTVPRFVWDKITSPKVFEVLKALAT